jgi:hypothetical protein
VTVGQVGALIGGIPILYSPYSLALGRGVIFALPAGTARKDLERSGDECDEDDGAAAGAE